MLDALTIPPKLLTRGLDDLHKLAVTIPELTRAAERLPTVEDELSAQVAQLREEAVRGTIQGVRDDIAELRDKIPGL